MYCTLRTNWKNNLIGNDSDTEESHASGDELLWGLFPSLPQRNSTSSCALPTCQRQEVDRSVENAFLHTGMNRCPFCGSDLVAFFFKAKSSCQSFRLLILLSQFLARKEKKRKITFLVERRRQRRTAAWPWTSQPPTSQWQGRNIQYCSGESSHHTWTKVGDTERTKLHVVNQLFWKNTAMISVGMPAASGWFIVLQNSGIEGVKKTDNKQQHFLKIYLK